MNNIFSPGFKSVAAMAGWDEEVLLTAILIVDDTPDQESKHKKRTELPFKTPPRNSRRKRRSHRSPLSIPICVLDLDGEETVKDGGVLHALKQANFSLQQKIQRFPQIEGTQATKAIEPAPTATTVGDKIEVTVGCPGLFRLPTDFSVEEASAHSNFLSSQSILPSARCFPDNGFTAKKRCHLNKNLKLLVQEQVFPA